MERERMWQLQLEEALRIRYIRLHFTVAMTEDTKWPADKVSALRGGMGEMLLRANCVRDRNCADCDFETECIVQKTMYMDYEGRPDFVTGKAGIGYLLECTDYREEYAQGDLLFFNLVLFGKAIAYFNQYMQAFFALGQSGVGKYHSKFQIVSVSNSRKRQILDGNVIYMEHYQIQTLYEYVTYRMGQIQERGCKNRMVFQTPLSLKYQNVYLRQFHMGALWNAVRRRIYMLESYEKTVRDIYHCDGMEGDLPVKIINQRQEKREVCRYSSTQDRKMALSGIVGSMQAEQIPGPALAVFLAGELTHIGKNTSFGFGQYRVE